MISKSQIVATVGPVSESLEGITALIKGGADVIRLNFAWENLDVHRVRIAKIREAAVAAGKEVKILIDLPGPRVQYEEGHGYDTSALTILTEQDEKSIEFGVQEKVDLFAVSFVGVPADVLKARELITKHGGKQTIVAKIERKLAVENIDSLIEVTDALMVARGDLGNEIALEEIPFVQAAIIKKAKEAGKPVITATQMMFSMTQSPTPTRADVTDVATAILQGSDAVMLSDETAAGKYPTKAVEMMERIVVAAENYLGDALVINPLV